MHLFAVDSAKFFFFLHIFSFNSCIDYEATVIVPVLEGYEAKGIKIIALSHVAHRS